MQISHDFIATKNCLIVMKSQLKDEMVISNKRVENCAKTYSSLFATDNIGC